jgi:hypothetical protein
VIAFAKQIPSNIGEHPLADVMQFEVEALQSAASRAAFILSSRMKRSQTIQARRSPSLDAWR